MFTFRGRGVTYRYPVIIIQSYTQYVEIYIAILRLELFRLTKTVLTIIVSEEAPTDGFGTLSLNRPMSVQISVLLQCSMSPDSATTITLTRSHEPPGITLFAAKSYYNQINAEIRRYLKLFMLFEQLFTTSAIMTRMN